MDWCTNDLTVLSSPKIFYDYKDDKSEFDNSFLNETKVTVLQ